MRHDWHVGVIVLLSLTLAVAAEEAGKFTPPNGYHLVAEDNCGAGRQKHVLLGKTWVYPKNMVEAPDEYRTIVFDNNACVLRYLKPNPKASYKVDVVYLDNGGRVQRLEANEREVHGDLKLPVKRPGRFVYDIPKAAYADGKKIDLKFIRVAGANALVCYIRIWSTDKTPLGGPAAGERAVHKPAPSKRRRRIAPIKGMWTSTEPIERDWLVQDQLVSVKSVGPCVERHLLRGRKILADIRQLGVNADDEALRAVDKTRKALPAAGSSDSDAWKKVYLAARWAVRRLAFKNPLLHDGEGMLFVRRYHPTRAQVRQTPVTV